MKIFLIEAERDREFNSIVRANSLGKALELWRANYELDEDEVPRVWQVAEIHDGDETSEHVLDWEALERDPKGPMHI